MFRSALKKIPFVKKVYTSVHLLAEKNRIERINEEYRKTIEPLLNEAVLKEKINNLDQSSQNTKKTYYVIAQQNTKVGIFGYINCFLPHIAYAVAKGYIPVIDMRSYNNIYIPTDQFGKLNAWELFFEQPMHVGLDDMQDGVVIRCPDMLWYRWMPNSCPMMDDDNIKMWAILLKKYIRFNESAKRYIDLEQSSILNDVNNTVGVIYRGTTYTKGQAVGHPIQPTMKMLADAVENIIQEKMQNIFIWHQMKRALLTI